MVTITLSDKARDIGHVRMHQLYQTQGSDAMSADANSAYKS